MTTQEKISALNQIAEEIKNFTGLDIAKNAKHPVPGEGNPDAEIMCIGEAPGQVEDNTGRPFVGQSGQFMAKTLLETTGLKREDVFITNIVKYRPPDNRDPFPDEIEACRDWLDRQIKIINPKVIVTLGRFSMGKFITGVTISRVHGVPRTIQFQGSTYTVFPMFHPAAALRAGEVLKQFKADFVKLNQLLNQKPDKPGEASKSELKKSEQTSLL